MNTIYPSWSDYEEALCAIEERPYSSGRKPDEVFVEKRNPKAARVTTELKMVRSEEARHKRNARNGEYMKRRREAWVAKGLTTLGKPRKNLLALDSQSVSC